MKVLWLIGSISLERVPSSSRCSRAFREQLSGAVARQQLQRWAGRTRTSFTARGKIVDGSRSSRLLVRSGRLRFTHISFRASRHCILRSPRKTTTLRIDYKHDPDSQVSVSDRFYRSLNEFVEESAKLLQLTVASRIAFNCRTTVGVTWSF